MAEQSMEHSRLRWRCRRGIRELDLMLEAWLEGAAGASAHQLAEFARLLELPDPELERYLVWGDRPADPALAAMAAAIRELHP